MYCKTLWFDKVNDRFFLIPDDVKLPSGDMALHAMAGRRLCRVSRRDIAPFEISRDEAKVWLDARFDQFVEGANAKTLDYLSKLLKPPPPPATPTPPPEPATTEPDPSEAVDTLLDDLEIIDEERGTSGEDRDDDVSQAWARAVEETFGVSLPEVPEPGDDIEGPLAELLRRIEATENRSTQAAGQLGGLARSIERAAADVARQMRGMARDIAEAPAAPAVATVRPPEPDVQALPGTGVPEPIVPERGERACNLIPDPGPEAFVLLQLDPPVSSKTDDAPAAPTTLEPLPAADRLPEPPTSRKSREAASLEPPTPGARPLPGPRLPPTMPLAEEPVRRNPHMPTEEEEPTRLVNPPRTEPRRQGKPALDPPSGTPRVLPLDPPASGSLQTRRSTPHPGPSGDWPGPPQSRRPSPPTPGEAPGPRPSGPSPGHGGRVPGRGETAAKANRSLQVVPTEVRGRSKIGPARFLRVTELIGIILAATYGLYRSVRAFIARR